MKPQRFEIRFDLQELENAISDIINVSHPLTALHRLANLLRSTSGRNRKAVGGRRIFGSSLSPGGHHRGERVGGKYSRHV